MAGAWQPSCSLEQLRLRAQLLQEIRGFFAEKAVLEVETPLLSQCSGTDPQLEFFTTTFNFPPRQQTLYLHTSPEFAMKRLLAAGSGSIYQICKVFRNGEMGRFHNPEFTMLEWYRVGFGLAELMEEIDELIGRLFQGRRALQATQRISYQEVFEKYTGLNALVFSHADYCTYALKNNLPEAIDICGVEHAVWLDFIFSHKVQPFLGENCLCLVYGYPACQSSLARINEKNKLITDRVELFVSGIELGNGFFELSDASEQGLRFDNEIEIRRQKSLPEAVKDHRLIEALQSGLLDCSGVAVGLDRLIMLASGESSIEGVLAFSLPRA